MMTSKVNVNKASMGNCAGINFAQRKAAAVEGTGWEMRPGGMLVQRRNLLDSSSPRNSTQINDFSSSIKLKVKFGSSQLEIRINPHASFGELKKILVAPTGLHPADQKLFFKGKERDSCSYLDFVGVKDGSMIVVVEDILRQEKRYLELRRNATMEKALRSVEEVTVEVDRLGGQVASLESVILGGGKVAEKELLNLIELLMSQLMKLDAIIADSDVKTKRKTQVVRVQKYIEVLDRLKVVNAASTGGLQQQMQEQKNLTVKEPKLQGRQTVQHFRDFTSQQVVVTTIWEKF